MNEWAIGVSTGIWIMSAIWIYFSSRSIKASERSMRASEAHMKEIFDDLTAAQMRRHTDN